MEIKTPDSTKETFSDLEQRIINKLFITFEDIFQGFKANYGTPAAYDGAKRQWLIAFKTENIGDTDKIRLVCNECRKMESPFMLTLGKFISIYKSIGLYDRKYPMLDTKRIEIQKSSNDTAAVYLKSIKDLLK